MEIKRQSMKAADHDDSFCSDEDEEVDRVSGSDISEDEDALEINDNHQTGYGQNEVSSSLINSIMKQKI